MSDSPGQAITPTLAFDAGTLYAAWQDSRTGTDEIYAAILEWIGVGRGGHGADSGGGVSNTGGAATSPELAANDGELYLLWLDNQILNLSGNTIAPYVEQWDGSEFVERSRRRRQLPRDRRRHQ